MIVYVLTACMNYGQNIISLGVKKGMKKKPAGFRFDN